MFTPIPIGRFHTAPPVWLIPDLLPQGSLVVLDGPSCVGKSLLAAALAGYIHHHVSPSSSNQQPVLWLNGHQRCNLLAGYLLVHQIPSDRQQLHLVCENATDRQGNEADFGMIEWLNEAVEANQPRLIIIDSLDQVCPFLATLDSYRQRYFLTGLEQMADKAKASVLILHQSTGAPTSPAIHLAAHRRLQLSWHPVNRSFRLLTVTKCELGHIGKQFQIDISPAGQVTWQQLGDEDRLPQLSRLSRTFSMPKPRGPASCIHEIMHKLSQLLTEPTPAREVKAFLLDEGYTRYSIRTALSAIPLKTMKKGPDWWYHLPPSSCGVSTTPQLDKMTGSPLPTTRGEKLQGKSQKPEGANQSLHRFYR